MSIDAAFQRLKDANPVPDPMTLRDRRPDSIGVGDRTRERSLHAETDTTPIMMVRPPDPGPRRRPALSMIAALAILILAVAVPTLFLTTRNGPIDTVAGGGVLTVDVLTDVDLSPFTDSTAEPVTGFDVDLLTEMARRSGLVLRISESLREFSTQPEAHLFLVEFGEVDVTTRGYRADLYNYSRSINVTGDRLAREAHFTNPYFLQDLAMIVDTTATPKLRSLDDLTAGDTVAAWGDANASFWIDDHLVPEGIIPGYVFEAGPRRPGPKSATTPLDAVASGDAVAAFVHSAIAFDLAGAYPGLEVVALIDTNIPLGFAVDSDNDELLAALNQALTSMIDDGTYQSIYDRWFTDPSGSVASKDTP